MDLWIVLCVTAALFQTVRFMLQKHLSQVRLSASGATLARFLYSAPLVVVVTIGYLTLLQRGFQAPPGAFWIYAVVGGTAQVSATVCTVMLFGRRNFAVGMTVIKTEVLMTALVGFIVLGEVVSQWGIAAILVGMCGVLVLSGSIEGEGHWTRRIFSPSTALGLAGGALFAVSGVCYRGATLLIDTPDPFERALVTLSFVTSMQMIGMLIWLAWRDRGEIGKVISAWRTAGFVGLTSIAGSFCWFAAYSLVNAAYVKAVGQVEVIFGIFATTLFFKERISGREYLGIALITASVLALIVLV
jgi:drug/metabolite transporter (DMT)-like permease